MTKKSHGLIEGAEARFSHTRAARNARADTLTIGIASYDQMKARTLAIARGELKPSPDDPKVWLPSTETLGKVLSGKNRELLARIRSARPDSLQALADMTGREVSNLSRTLKTMERYGLVQLERAGRTIRPRVPYVGIRVAIPIEEIEPAA